MGKDILVKICENLPLDITIFEKRGFCDKPSENCEYCNKLKEKVYYCYKKTYTHIPATHN